MHGYRFNFYRKITGDFISPDSLTTPRLVKFVNDARSQGYEDYTIRRTLDSISELCVFLMKHGLLAMRPEFPVVKLPPPKPKNVDISIVGSLIKAGLTFEGRFRAGLLADFFALTYCTGYRVSDILSLTHENLIDGKVVREADKTHKHHGIPIPAWCYRRFEGIRGRLIPVGYACLIKRIKQLCQKAGVRRVTPKMVRATSAYYWNLAGGNCGFIILGHALPGSSKATAHYLAAEMMLGMYVSNLLCPCDDLLTEEERDENHKLDMTIQYMLKVMTPDKKRMLAELAKALNK